MKMGLILFALFWMIALSLGYPTLARYSPANSVGLTDARSYEAMVAGGTENLGHHQFRVLIPSLAKPIEKVVRGRLGTWNSGRFALLVVNGFFVAWAALILLRLGAKLFGDTGVGLIASFLYLLSFNVSNLMLAGLVDSVESWAIIAAAWAMLNKRWLFLPVIGALAALGKETSVMLLVPFCLAWIIALARDKQLIRSPGLWVIAMIAAQAMTLVLVSNLMDAHLLRGPGLGEDRGLFWYVKSFLSLFNKPMLYGFCWLVPLGVLAIRRMPPEWSVASFAALAVTLAVGSYFGDVSRPAFNAIAPLLLLSSALFLSDLVRGNRRLNEQRLGVI